MNLFDNTAFPLREHTKKKEKEIRDIVMEKLTLSAWAVTREVSREISAVCASVPAWPAPGSRPQIILCDEPTRSGPGPYRLPQSVDPDINAQIDATVLIVTHNINVARTVPDNIACFSASIW